MIPFSPMSDLVLSSVLDVYNQTNAITTGLMGLIVSIRVAFLIPQFAGAESYAEIFKDLIAYLGISNLFPMMIKLIIELINCLILKVTYVPAVITGNTLTEVFVKYYKESLFFEIMMGLGDLLMVALVKSTYSVILSIFIAIAPIVFVLGLTFGLRGKINSYFSTFIAIALWPVLWNLLGLLGNKLLYTVNDSAVASFCFSLVITVVQLLSPIFSIFLFMSLNPAGAVYKITKFVRLK